MRLLLKLVGIGLILLGIYFLGKNIVFTTQAPGYWWKPIPAWGSILSVMAGVWTLVFADSDDRSIGVVLIGVGIALAFISGGIVVQPTSLWTFALSLFSFMGGYKLLTVGRL